MAYQLSNLNQRIKAIKDRLSSLNNINSFKPFEINEIKVFIAEGYIIVDFPAKPDEEMRKKLKTYPASLKWSRNRTAFVRKYTGQNKYYFEKLKEVLT